MIEEKTKERFVELRAQGLSFDKIAGEIGVSKPTLIGWDRELRSQIVSLENLAIEALNVRFFLTYQSQVSLFGEQMEKIKQELGNRDFKDIPTDKLLSLLMTLHEKLTAKKIDPSIKTATELEKEWEENKKRWDKLLPSLGFD